MKNSQKGFSIVEGLLLVVIIGLISGVSWYVWQAKQDATNKLDNAVDIANSKPNVQTDLTGCFTYSGAANYFPVQYQTTSSQYQKVAQAFKPNKSAEVSKVTLRASFGVGNEIQVDLREAPDSKNLDQGSLLARGKFAGGDIVNEKEFDVTFDKKVGIKSDTVYAIIIATTDKETQTAVAFSEGKDTSACGKMHVYTRLIGGNGEILNNEHSWQSKNNGDLAIAFK